MHKNPFKFFLLTKKKMHGLRAAKKFETVDAGPKSGAGKVNNDIKPSNLYDKYGYDDDNNGNNYDKGDSYDNRGGKIGQGNREMGRDKSGYGIGGMPEKELYIGVNPMALVDKL